MAHHYKLARVVWPCASYHLTQQLDWPSLALLHPRVVLICFKFSVVQVAKDDLVPPILLPSKCWVQTLTTTWKALATKSDNLTLIPRTHMVTEQTRVWELLSDLCTVGHHGIRTCADNNMQAKLCRG